MDKENPTNEPPSVVRWLWLLAVFVFGLTAALVLFFKAVGLFDAKDTGAAAIILVGAMATGAVTGTAAILRHSIDERNLALSTETEARLRSEASVKAMSLLVSTENPTKIQIGGVLLTLSSVGHPGIALALLDDIWREGRVPTEVAVSVIDDILIRGTPVERTSATAILAQNAESTLALGGRIHHMPDAIATWAVGSFALDVRRGAVHYLTRLAAHVTVDSGHGSHETTISDVGPVMVALYTALRADGDEAVQADCRVLLWALMKHCPILPNDMSHIFGVAGEMIPIEDVRAAANQAVELTKVSSRSAELVGRIKTWARG